MPLDNNLTTINLDNKNPKPQDNPNNIFVYFSYPSTPCSYQNMIQAPDGNFYNLLNFSYKSNAPNISIASQKNFTNLDTYTASALHITQMIHTSSNFTVYKNDLELIIEHTPTSTKNTGSLFLCIFLHYDTNSKNTGGDFNTLFQSLQNPDYLNSNTSDFNMKNTSNSPPIPPLSFDIGIQSILQSIAEQKSTPCTYYEDNNNNIFVIMCNPISISHSNFQIVQKFMQQSTIDQVPNTSISAIQSDFSPSTMISAYFNVLLKHISSNTNDIKTPPLNVKDDKIEKSKSNSNKTETVNKDGKDTTNKDDDKDKKKQNFTTMEGFKEGNTENTGKTTYKTCYPADSSNKKIVTAVNDSGNETQLVLAFIQVSALMGLALAVFFYAYRFYMILYKIIADLNLYFLGDTIISQVTTVSWLLGFAFFATGIGLFAGGLDKHIKNKNDSNNMGLKLVLTGIMLLVIMVLYKLSLSDAYYSGNLLKNIKAQIGEIDNDDDFKSAFTKSRWMIFPFNFFR
jgi:hypothetical protein